MKAIFAPGRDRVPLNEDRPNVAFTGGGAGGYFANFFQGFTPKYAINNGYRADLFRNTLARMYLRVDAAEMGLFNASVTDPHTQKQLLPRLVGDPLRTSQNENQNQPNQNATTQGDASAARVRNVSTNGYLDFLIQTVQAPLQEKMQVQETLADNFVAFAFGQSAPIFNYTGFLINTVQDDQATNMLRLYLEVLRATQMARRQKSLSLSYDSYVLNGVMINLVYNHNSQNELFIPFSFQFLVKRIAIVNYTQDWVPTRADSPFAADPLAIAYDGRPRTEGALTSIAARTPAGSTEFTPVPERTTDQRVNSVNPVNQGLVSTQPNDTQGTGSVPSSNNLFSTASGIANTSATNNDGRPQLQSLVNQTGNTVYTTRFETLETPELQTNRQSTNVLPSTNVATSTLTGRQVSTTELNSLAEQGITISPLTTVTNR